MSMRHPLLGHDFRKKQPILSFSFHHPTSLLDAISIALSPYRDERTKYLNEL